MDGRLEQSKSIETPTTITNKHLLVASLLPTRSSPKNRDIVKSTIGCVSELTLIRDTDNNTTTKNQETIYKATTSLQMLDKSRIK